MTDVDRRAAESLAKIADIDIESLAREMFNAGSNLKNKTAEEICFQDFKKFNIGDYGVRCWADQFNEQDELHDIKES